MTSGDGPDDRLAHRDGGFAEQLVRDGRAEPSAAERLPCLADGLARPLVVGELPLLLEHPRPRPRRGRSWLVAVVVLAGLGASSWTVREQGALLEVATTASTGLQPLDRTATPGVSGPGYSFLTLRPDGSGPVTFDGCAPVHYVVRPDGAPPSGAAAVARAFAQLSAATGLQFVDDGLTDEAPDDERHLAAGADGDPPPVLLAWATAREWPRLHGHIAGEAGPVTVTPAGSSDPSYVSGQVVLDAEDLAHAPGDERGAATVHGVVLHELGHLVGLGHVDDRRQLMHPEAQGLAEFGPGDLAGLRVLGSGPCR